jgi:hypothetical protein
LQELLLEPSWNKLEPSWNQAVQIRVPVWIVVLEFVLQIQLQMVATFVFANSTTPVLDVK